MLLIGDWLHKLLHIVVTTIRKHHVQAKKEKRPCELLQGRSSNVRSTSANGAYSRPTSLAMRSEYCRSVKPASASKSTSGASFHSASRR